LHVELCACEVIANLLWAQLIYFRGHFMELLQEVFCPALHATLYDETNNMELYLNYSLLLNLDTYPTRL
ncbi:hypothetical protein ACJX0J_009123, partial [Zea mays]